MNAAIAMESGTESLMESLLITDVLGYADEAVSGSGFPVTNELYYEYDYGDSWIVKLTKLKSCEDLVANHSVTKEELDEARETVKTKHKPVCLSRVGLNVMDDVGGLSGFANFLRAINEPEDKEEAADFRRWARSMGWKQKKVDPKKVL
ncbi:pRiA4b ORF-3-like protein [Alkalibacterium putridalgicola]|nr:pRiA4b ORF-3-like protein [Alkalibacterium putridalgicola]